MIGIFALLLFVITIYTNFKERYFTVGEPSGG